MARTAKDAETGEEIVILEGDEAAEESTPAEQDYDLALDNWIADLGGALDAAISVYKYDEKSNQPAFVDTVGAQDMEGVALFKMLREEYGGGKFRIQLRAGGRIVKTQTLRIEPPPKSTATNSGPLGNDLPALIRELKADTGNDTAIMMQAMQQQNAQFQTMMVEMVKALGSNNNAPAPPTMAEVITTVAALKDMSAPPPSVEPTELILKGIELANALKGDNEGGDANMYTLLQSAVKELGGTIANAAKVMPNMVAAPGTPQPATAQPAPAMQITADDTARPREPIEGDPAPIEVETKSRNEIPEQLQPFEPYVNSLVQMAAAKKDPELYAEVIIDQLGDEYADAWIGKREGREMLLGIFTQAQPFARWFEMVGEIITEILHGEDENAGIDDNPEATHNADETPQDGAATTLQPDGNVQIPTTSEHDDAPTDDPSIDGDIERPGGDSSNVTLDGETGKPIEDDAASS